jgi:hypothetical protein
MTETELEHLLRKMQPTRPDPQLLQRTALDMELAELFRTSAPAPAPTRPVSTWISRASWIAVGAAAAVMLMSVAPGPEGSRPVMASIHTPTLSTPVVTSSNEWVSMDDGGIVYSDQGEPEHVVSVTSVERHRWVDPEDGAEYIVELPRQESMYLPVSIQ